ncbi:MAG: hypothetical protein ACRDZ8_02530 [Acidimicrobiales bacterium]
MLRYLLDLDEAETARTLKVSVATVHTQAPSWSCSH